MIAENTLPPGRHPGEGRGPVPSPDPGRARLLSDPLLIALSVSAFAGNSLLCRLALRETAIDAATFTTVRLVAGALFSGPAGAPAFDRLAGRRQLAVGARPLGLRRRVLLRLPRPHRGDRRLDPLRRGAAFDDRRRRRPRRAAFSPAGRRHAAGARRPGLPAAARRGRAAARQRGADDRRRHGLGRLFAARPVWRRKGAGDPLATTAGNFKLATLPALALSLATLAHARPELAGLACAAASGAITSGAGYAIWYSVLPRLGASQAATVQLTVPVLAAAGGVLLLGETPTSRLAIAAVVVLGGVALTLRRPALLASSPIQPR